ncbi:D-alanyl-D-alanine-carboxypeptidase/endopeptidase AmpH [Telmatobacter bradus]|uniref:D-alanyl-D-alanine- carboxypeptidase/endopeptidase AmpH n=1 Tax=Telmatobacter bradus TaxID=474953 RepID=UPI003B4359D8
MRLLLVFLFALGLASGFAQSATPVDLSNASALGNELYEHSGATGMVIVLVHNDKVFIEGYGETAPRSHQTPTADSMVRLCSITKIFTTDLLTKLALDHTVTLNDPLQKYAPTGFTVPMHKQPVTLLNLATHTAGLYREVGYPPDGTPHFTYPDYATRWNWLEHQSLRSTPGTAAAYSNVGFDLLSDALSDAAHEPYATLLHERTLTPLRMWHTTFYPSPEQCANLLVSAQSQGPCTATGNTSGSGGLYSTAGDMAHWLKYQLGTGGPGFPVQAAAAQQPYINADDLVRASGLDYAGKPSGIGLGWLHLLSPDNPSHLVEKDGGGAGYLTYIALHPASHTGLFVAMTIGRNGYHANLFKASNELLYKLTGAPADGDAIGLPPAGVRGRHGRLRAVAQARPTAKQPVKPASKAGRRQTTKATRTAPREAAKATPRAAVKPARKAAHPAKSGAHPKRKQK